VGWGIFCLIACLAYSVWKCPWDTGGNDQEEK
jgi:hypothetical protein